MVSEFQDAAGPAVFLLSLKAGGTGLNLTAANHVIHVDRWWNPAVEDQATDRAFRIGQRRDVQVRKFVCVGTVEERIDQMIEDKKALAEAIVGTGESWLTELSVADLRQVDRAVAGGGVPVRDSDVSGQRAVPVLSAVAAAQGRRRDQGAQQARLDRRAVVVAPVHRRAGVVRAAEPAEPGAGATPGPVRCSAWTSAPGT